MKFFSQIVLRSLGIAFLLAYSCTPKQTAALVKAPITPRTPEFLRNKLPQKNGASVGSLNARASLTVENDGQIINASAEIIWIRDSVIWINVKKFGFEAVRALITKDSAFVLNRIEKTCTIRGLDAVERQYNLPDGFRLIQQTLFANAWLFKDLDLKSGVVNDHHLLKGSNEQFAAQYELTDEKFFLSKEHFIQQKDNRTLSLEFEDYKKLSGIGMFPYLRHISANSPDYGDARFTVEFNTITLDVPKNYRFDIPAHYTRQ